MEVSSAGNFLMIGVDMRSRFDLYPPNLLINPADETGYKYMIRTAKLWTQEILPNQDALFSSNGSLININ